MRCPYHFSTANFNPRSREGSDIGYNAPKVNRYISIHAPEKGATHSGFGDLLAQIFQSTLPRRERRRGTVHFQFPRLISIHAPEKGATPSVSASCSAT